MLIRRIARPLLATAFVAEGVDVFRNTSESAAAAGPVLDKGREVLPDGVSQQLPSDAATLIRINAAVQIGGGALLAFGKFPRVASLALAGTLVPSKLGSHQFWNETDPDKKKAERKEFLTGVSLLGGLMIAAVDTEGKPSLGWRGRRAASRASSAVVGVLPIGSSNSATADHLSEGWHAAAEKGRDLAAVAQQRGAELAETARDRAPDVADAVRERGSQLADLARDRGPDLADAVKDRGSHLADVARDRGPDVADAFKNRSGLVAEAARERAAAVAEAARERRR
ncbi:DoxX family protein [Antrihabitans cavernicola]|uniref:DoxX family protein n=1 Tax=Antrihabitans cavernicola TaxID=2495913 RepID=A0A5A7S832_9NOCA|nr:DoxX family protein [Spelaeibacter cavernicola]KAA0021087.1 DoxX family protein [Spelaeibacter cavernicola]